ncbi:FG-GAP-like repeat-containing protein [Singulisphaera sp. PoT]|uniref:FG-GAP-like repeat-containing protein n=1 Tax=Singulisphaera sp. PoT TaxID=3411797 RepID=UPI003BF599DF
MRDVSQDNQAGPTPGRSPLRAARFRTVLACVGLAACLLALVGGAWWLISDRRFRAGLERVQGQVGAGQFEPARVWLTGLSAPWSGDPETLYWLGVCERALGNRDAALTAWTRVPPESRHGEWAEIERARLLIAEFGRYAEAETILEKSMVRPGKAVARRDVRKSLAELYFWEGRQDALRRLIQSGWEQSEDRVGELRNLWMNDSAPAQRERIREILARASERAADDDRVWLARANLALSAGSLDEVRRLSDECLKRRADDEAVWRLRLEWALSAGRPDEVECCLFHLSTTAFSLGELLALEARVAAMRLDGHAELAALEKLLEGSPGDTWALERLAVLVWNQGYKEKAQELRARKAEADRNRDRYRSLLKGEVTAEHYVELGKLAEALGRRFEAQGWWTLAAKAEPDNQAIASERSRLHEEFRAVRAVANQTLAERFGKGTVVATSETRAFDSPRVPRFVDEAEVAGLRFQFDSGTSPQRQLPETMSGGIALLDYDGDSHLDVFLVQGGPFPPAPGSSAGGHDRLFRNRGNGTFEDATASSGLAATACGYGHGATVADYDNDGDPDLFVTRWRSYSLYQNQGNGQFIDVGDRVGLGGDRDWPTSAAFADFDNDGDLDLYVCHYLAWDEKNPRLCPRASKVNATGDESPNGYCMPHLFEAKSDHVFRNEGGRFVDVTAEAGIADKEGRGLGVVATDLDEDGKIDLVVANDATANAYYHNVGHGKFEEIAVQTGVACNAEGAFQAGMGIVAADLDGDTRPDLAVTNFYGESTTLFRNLGQGAFADESSISGVAAPSRFLLGFGIAAFDANNDGRLDLATANGHVTDDRPQFPYAMPAQLLLGSRQGKFVEARSEAGDCWSVPRIGRGLAAGDLDNDGRVDLLIVSQNSPLAYLHNRTEGTHAVTLLLEGAGSNRDAIGARVTLRSGDVVQAAQRNGGGSYLSSGDPRLHFGVPGGSRVVAAEVRWPSGRTDSYREIPVDGGYRLREGDPTPRSLNEYRISDLNKANSTGVSGPTFDERVMTKESNGGY